MKKVGDLEEEIKYQCKQDTICFKFNILTLKSVCHMMAQNTNKTFTTQKNQLVTFQLYFSRIQLDVVYVHLVNFYCVSGGIDKDDRPRVSYLRPGGIAHR